MRMTRMLSKPSGDRRRFGAITLGLYQIPGGFSMQGTIQERFWAKVQKTDTCWFWTAAITAAGYGLLGDGERLVYAHRYSYESSYGLIPPELTIDHLCRVRHCVNPAHLDAVSRRVNNVRGNGWSGRNARKSICPHGHSYALYARINPDGSRRCGICRPPAGATIPGVKAWQEETLRVTTGKD